jgi:hypothetical protein
MVVWFAVIAALGLLQIIREPAILGAIDPRHAISLLRSGRPGSYQVLNAIASSSQAAKRFTPTSAISAGGRSSVPGTGSCCRRSR